MRTQEANRLAAGRDVEAVRVRLMRYSPTSHTSGRCFGGISDRYRGRRSQTALLTTIHGIREAMAATLIAGHWSGRFLGYGAIRPGGPR
jgi:hypothetical protein